MTQYENVITDPAQLAKHLPSHIEIHEPIARGGQGVVYRGTFNGTAAAIKAYLPGQIHKRIQREVAALSRIDSPTIVRLLDFSIVQIFDHEIPLVITEWIAGQPLEQRVQDTLSESDVYHLAFDITSSIEQLWRHRIVHRDIKPSNILINSSGRFCLIDLGLARHLSESSLTALGATWGTFGYLSPEQTRGVRQLTCKSDLFSLGVVLVESALGKHPTNRDQLRLLAQRLYENLPPPLEKFNHANLFKKLLQARPTARPKPEEVLSELAQYSQ